MNLDWVIILIIFGFTGIASPGPNFLIILKNTLQYGKKTGLHTMMGLLLGNFIHILYSSVGVGYIISQSAIFFTLFKIFGASYLIFLAVKILKADRKKVELDLKDNCNKSKSFKDGFLTSITNPKATLFFVTLFSIVLTKKLSFNEIVISESILSLIALLWFTSIIYLFSVEEIRKKYFEFEYFINKVFALLFVFFAVNIFLMIFK